MASLLRKRIQFYHTLGTMEEAGVSRVQALQQHHLPPFGRAGRILADNLQAEGLTLSEAMRRMPRLFSAMECALVAVGEQTGGVDLVFRSLAQWFQVLEKLRATIISGLIYPALTYHFAAVAIPFISMFTDNVSLARAATRAACLLALPWAVLLVARICAGFFRTDLIGAMLVHMPFIGTFIYRLDCTRFFHAYALSLQAGSGILQAMNLSADCCVNSTMRKWFHQAGSLVQSEGITFTEAFTAVMPASHKNAIILTLMQTGEQTGKSDESAARIARVFQEETETILQRIATILPTLVYLALALYIALQIFKFYGKLLAPMKELL